VESQGIPSTSLNIRRYVCDTHPFTKKKKKFVRELIACEDAIYSMSVVDKSVWMGGFAEVFRVNLNARLPIFLLWLSPV